jgi:hypothetical protein
MKQKRRSQPITSTMKRQKFTPMKRETLKLATSEVEYSEGKENSILLIEDNMEIRGFS